MATLIISVIFGYFVIGFITTVLIHKFDSRFERGDEYDAVFTTLAWPYILAYRYCSGCSVAYG